MYFMFLLLRSRDIWFQFHLKDYFLSSKNSNYSFLKELQTQKVLTSRF